MITSRPHCCMSVSGSQSDWFRVRAEFWPILRTVNGMWIHWDTQLLKYEKQKYGIYRPWSACLEYGSITVTNTNTVTITITAYSSSSLFIQLRPSYNRNYLVIWWEVKWSKRAVWKCHVSVPACVRACVRACACVRCIHSSYSVRPIETIVLLLFPQYPVTISPLTLTINLPILNTRSQMM